MSDKPKWCYISGPYTIDDPVANTHKMSVEWRRLQHKYPDIVFINPLIGSMAQHLIHPEAYEFWIDYDLNLLRVLAASGPGVVYRFRPGVHSSGADREIALAESLGVPVSMGGDIDRFLNQFETPVNPHVRPEPDGGEPDYDEVPKRI